jgi:ABC-type transport system involved in multi-copper enzyme maturation permease subunit
MMSFTDILTVARAETAAAFRGRKGLSLVVVLILLAGLPSMLRLLGEHSVDAAALQRAHLAALVKIYDVAIARTLVDCPPALVVSALATFFFQPFLVLYAGSDRLAAEIDSGSIRYLTVRAPRGGIAVGKAVGLWAIVSLVTIGVQLAITIVAIVDAPGEWLSTLRWFAAIATFSCAAAVVYASLCTFLGALLARPRLVFLIGIGLVLALRLVRTALREHNAERLSTIFPGALDQLFLTPGAAAKLQATAVVAAWSLVLLTGTVLVFRRRAV